MFSQSLAQGVFSSALKRAVIVPIFKSGDKSILHPVTHLLTDNKTEMCTILLDQFSSVFSTPKPDMIISDPVSFFSC